MTRAFIYTSGMDVTAAFPNDSQINQSMRCQQYAKNKGYEVVHVFHEYGGPGRVCWDILVGWAEQYSLNGHDVRIIVDNPRNMPAAIRRWEIAEFGIEFVDGFIESEAPQAPVKPEECTKEDEYDYEPDTQQPKADKPGLYEREETLSDAEEHMSNWEDANTEPGGDAGKVCPRDDYEAARNDLVDAMSAFSTFLRGFMGVMVK